MTKKRLAIKIARKIRNIFDFHFIESQKIARAMVNDFCNPEKFLTCSEEHLMIVLHQLMGIEYDKDIALSISGAIDSNIIESKCNSDMSGYITTFRLNNKKSSTVTDVTVEL